MATDTFVTSNCPVLFCGIPTLSAGFDGFYSSASELSGVDAQQIVMMEQASEKASKLEFGVIVVLIPNKSELQHVLNLLSKQKSLIARGLIRVISYNLMNNEKVSVILKQRGSSEIISDGLSQKALIHKLQRHIQIVLAKRQTSAKGDESDDLTSVKAGAKTQVPAKQKPEGKIKFIPPIENENDCWLLKSKKDFKFVRGMWMGQLVGPGPSAGGWIALSVDDQGKGVYQWKPRAVDGQDVFVPGKGAWYFSGRQPEFDWKINRWRLISQSPSLFFKTSDGAMTLYRVRCVGGAVLELCLNSSVAKGKLKAIIQTFQADKRFREESPKEDANKDLLLTAEDQEEQESSSDFDDEEGSKDWGDLDTEENASAQEWNSQGDTEEEKKPEWGGLDIGRGNKFNHGRGIGQGQGGSKGYKYDEEESAFVEKNRDWATGVSAFEKIQLDITMYRLDSVGEGGAEVILLERQETDLLLDAPQASYLEGEKVKLEIYIAQGLKRRNLEIQAVFKRKEQDESDRSIILLSVEAESQPHLGEIQTMFDARQEEMLQFLREAKGDG